MVKKLLLLTFDKYFYYIEDYFNTTLNIFRIFSYSNFPGKGYDRRFVDNNSNLIVNGFLFLGRLSQPASSLPLLLEKLDLKDFFGINSPNGFLVYKELMPQL